jgi:hypothetical protein
MPDDVVVDEEETYEANTVEELKEELRARDLPTSGHKDELIARLEEDDAGREAGTTSTDIVLREEEEVADPWKRVYSPYELPLNTAAAQAFVDAHPDAVDPNLELDPERQALAQANIQDHVDQMAEFGIVVEDPRLEGYTPGPHIDSLNPNTASTGQQTTITVSGSGFDDTSTVEIDGAGQTTTFVDASNLTVTHRSTQPSGTEIFTVRNGDGQESNDMPFNVTVQE